VCSRGAPARAGVCPALILCITLPSLPPCASCVEQVLLAGLCSPTTRASDYDDANSTLDASFISDDGGAALARASAEFAADLHFNLESRQGVSLAATASAALATAPVPAAALRPATGASPQVGPLLPIAPSPPLSLLLCALGCAHVALVCGACGVRVLVANAKCGLFHLFLLTFRNRRGCAARRRSQRPCRRRLAPSLPLQLSPPASTAGSHCRYPHPHPLPPGPAWRVVPQRPPPAAVPTPSLAACTLRLACRSPRRQRYATTNG